MKKRILNLVLIIFIISATTAQQSFSQKLPQSIMNLSQDKVAVGLKEALEKGVEEQVIKLTQENGFYKNELVKILLPKEIQKIDPILRNMGMDNLADQGLLVLNRAAENAVKEATPIFVDAIKNITFNDAKNILLGEDNSATNYLERATSKSLYSKFLPIIQGSLEKVGADKVWSSIFSTYNSIPLVKPVNTDLTDYVTKETMSGVFKMIAVEEKNIRLNIGNSRTTQILKDVFGYQDKVNNNNKENTAPKQEDDVLIKKTRGFFKKLNIFKK